jgi:integrase
MFADWGFHDLRRTFATGLPRLGVPVQVAEAVLNHVSGSRAGVAGVYNRHDYGREAREALDRWAAHVLGLTAERKANVVVLAR